jgi:hypothetical protein
VSRARRVLAPLLAVVVVAVSAGCSDAHTEEEKAWADDGIGPDIVTLFVDPTFRGTADTLVTAYEDEHLESRVLVVAREEEHIASAVDDVDAPSVWIAPESTFEGREPDDATVALGASPLVIAYARDGRPAPPIDDFATKGNGTGMCGTDEPCGVNARQLLANLGLTADPDLVTDADTLVLQVADGTLEAALVHSVDAGTLWLRIVHDQPATDDPELADDWVARPFGQAGRTADLLDWLATSEAARLALANGGLTLPPPGAAEVGS